MEVLGQGSMIAAAQLPPGNKDDGAPPPFLTKTFEMVDDPATNAVVAWSGDDSFIVKDPGEFSINILPCYFKHNNLSSFVRQLNIYGFRKVNSDCWEFSHPNFRRGWFDLLKDIKRRKTATKEEKRSEMNRKHRDDSIQKLMGRGGSSSGPRGGAETTATEGAEIDKFETLLHDKDALISEVIKLRKQQDATQRMLAATLNELHETRCEQQRTQDTVEKVVSFLSTVVEGQPSAPLHVAFRKQNLAVEGALLGLGSMIPSPSLGGQWVDDSQGPSKKLKLEQSPPIQDMNNLTQDIEDAGPSPQASAPQWCQINIPGVPNNMMHGNQVPTMYQGTAGTVGQPDLMGLSADLSLV